MTHDSRYSSREDKSKKILAVLEKHLGGDLDRLNCIDVGCSNGGITFHLAPHFSRVIGMDIDRENVIQARKNSRDNRLSYTFASAHNIPFKNDSFDVVICAQVYEHVQDQQALAREIRRITKPGGVCFFSGPNRLKVMEEHYWLPFLSWLPHSLANVYLRLFRKSTYYDVYPLFYWELRNLWRNFRIHNCMLEMLREPNRYALNMSPRMRTLIQMIPDWVLEVMIPIYPNYNWILKKPHDETI